MPRRRRQHTHLQQLNNQLQLFSSSPSITDTDLLYAFLMPAEQRRIDERRQLREAPVPPRTPSPPTAPRTPSPRQYSAQTPRSRRRNETRIAAESTARTPTRRRRPGQIAQAVTPLRFSYSQRAIATPRSQRSIVSRIATPSRRQQAVQSITPTRLPRPRTRSRAETTDLLSNIILAEFYYAKPLQARAWKPRQNIARTAFQPHIDYRFILDTATHLCASCSALHWIEERKGNTSQANPQFTCCINGAIQIPQQPVYPANLQKLLADYVPGEQRRTRRSADFHQFIRHYNNSFSFCSLGAEIDEQLAQRLTGVYTFRAHGHLYHRIGALRAADNTKPSFAQLYIFDSDEEQLQLRQQAFLNLDPRILRIIQHCLFTHHPFIRAFKTNAERIRNDNSVTLRIGIVESANTDPRVYNRPTAREVAALIPTAGHANEGARQIVLENRANAGFKYINEQLPEYLPLRYPILFPHGELGWCSNFPRRNAPYTANTTHEASEEEAEEVAEDVQRGRNNSMRVSQQQWWKYFLQIRKPLPPQLLAGRLFHELVVDAFASISAARLQWLRHNQSSLRIASYAGMVDALHANDQITGADIGQHIILPASYTGSPRQMRNAYLDAIALTRFYGPPDFFITFTCNPQWAEIICELAQGQAPTDRPDIVNRVFNIKLKQLLHELQKVNIFGEAAVYCYTVEFQKRGLPHAHILLILRPSSRPQTAEDIDACVRADLPDPISEPLLYGVVVRNMMHGPCGRLKPNAPCMRDGHCRFKFPQRFQAETVIGENKRPIYARPNNGRTFQKPGTNYTYTNRDVATYNPYLSVRFNAHINIESCAGYSSVKYTFKYVYKGPDRATMTLQAAQDSNAAPQPVDEIQEFIDARYVAAHEAIWRIFEFRTHGRSVPVLPLAIHLPNQQPVAIRSEQALDVRLAQEAIQKTTLTEFFAENAKASTSILYQDFPASYTWNRARKQWQLRSKGFCVGRIIYLPISIGEAYYLRLLLVSIAGQKSFEDTRTFEGQVYSTFQAACLARGLLQDDGEYQAALGEAMHFQLGRQLRELFVTILANCSPADPTALWEQFKDALADDCPHQLRTVYNTPNPSDEEAYDLALCLLRSLLAARNVTLASCGLPEPERNWIEEFSTHSNRLLREQLSFNTEDMQAEVASGVPRMNTQQRQIYTTLCNAVDAGDGGLFFVDGPGGTGKTFLQNITLARQRLQNRVALAVASSGIAATLLSGGSTAHSRFKIPIEVHEDSSCNVEKQSHLAELLRQTRLIFWDEAVMCHRHAIEAVSRTLQDLRSEDDPRRTVAFGGIVVCFCGDFRQTLPIVKKGTRGQIVSATLKSSTLWQNMHVFKLTQNMRLLRPGLTASQRNEISSFATQLLQIGEHVDADGTSQWNIHADMLKRSAVKLAEAVFPDLQTQQLSAEHLRDSAILAPKNEVVVTINTQLLQSMPGQETISYSVDYCKDPDNASNFPVEFLHTIDLAGLPPHALRLKPGCPVMLLRNLDPTNGLCNGTRLLIITASRKLLRCSILGTRRHGEIIQLPRIPLDAPSLDAGVDFTRVQFPVKLAFAMTINKAQGQSLNTVGLLLDPEVFSHGQLYVALSRVTRIDGIFFILPPTAATRAGRIKNVVYPEVF